ncbi:hypothetical protein CPAV1605_1220 [seawater metagenome]|uniref:ATP adenylyltransferase n=1 Tax=seawater metagenome TaxID=1561972 RepID=A0A5E8CL10_9ZZZZ
MEYNIKITYNNSLKKDVDILLNYLKEVGFYNSLKKNKDRLDDVTYELIGDTGLILKKIPYRDSCQLSPKSKLKKCITNSCVLCDAIQNYERIEPLSLSKALLWKSYLIRPNDFPYLKDHLLILSSDHNHGSDGIRGTQDELHLKKHILLDMIEFYKLMDMEGTMFFNGMAGNTQTHFHFHYVKDKLPLEDFLFNSSELEFEEFTTKNKSKLFIFDSISKKKCFKGLLFVGKEKHVCKNVLKVLQKIKQKTFEYNILFIPNKDYKENVMIIVFIRDNKNIKKSDPPLGASIIAGMYTRPDIDIKEARQKKIENKIFNYCDKIVVKPNKSFFENII